MINTTRFAAKLNDAVQALEAMQAKAAKLAATGPHSAADWSSYANQLAEAEGEAQAWSRVNMTVGYFSREGRELTDLIFLDAIMDLLAEGADDSWSGRGNDVRRAHFDGVRKACKAMHWFVTAD